MKYKIGIRVVIAVLLSILLVFVSNMLMPTIGNDIAVDQLKNDDAYFMAMETWHNIPNVLTYTGIAIWSLTAGFIVRDIYIYVKNKKENM